MNDCAGCSAKMSRTPAVLLCVALAAVVTACVPRVVPAEKAELWRKGCREAGGRLFEVLNPDGSLNSARCVRVDQ